MEGWCRLVEAEARPVDERLRVLGLHLAMQWDRIPLHTGARTAAQWGAAAVLDLGPPSGVGFDDRPHGLEEDRP
jgi:hypothetical protein